MGVRHSISDRPLQKCEWFFFSLGIMCRGLNFEYLQKRADISRNGMVS